MTTTFVSSGGCTVQRVCLCTSVEEITHLRPVLTASVDPGQPTADGDGGAEPPCGSRAVINRMISSRSAAEGRPMPDW